MRTLYLRPALLLMLTFGLPACPGEGTGDEGAESTATTTMSTTTMSTTTMSTDATTGDATTGDTTAASDTPTGGSTAASSSSGEPVFGEIEVTVNYAGAQTGTLSAVAITEFPPMGPPSAIATEMMPTFPWVGTLSGLEAGEYIIFATLDVGNNNPTIPGAEDPQSSVMMPVTVVVDGAGPFTAEVTLVDPM